MQVKLLRAIQERRVRKVGSTSEEPVDARILSATHQDLAKLVVAGRFRQDLYYRLNVIELHVPNLRERSEDIAMLADVILDRLAQRAGAERVRLSPEALRELQSYPFPGNVRELENVLERGVALAAGRELTAADLMLPAAEAPPEPDAIEPVPAFAEDVEPSAEAAAIALPVDGVPPDLTAYLDTVESAALRAALRKTGGNRTAAAQLLGLTFRQLRYRMQRLGLK
jgi:two-component system response regulator PilR (NtrC family)